MTCRECNEVRYGRCRWSGLEIADYDAVCPEAAFPPVAMEDVLGLWVGEQRFVLVSAFVHGGVVAVKYLGDVVVEYGHRSAAEAYMHLCEEGYTYRGRLKR